MIQTNSDSDLETIKFDGNKKDSNSLQIQHKLHSVQDPRKLQLEFEFIFELESNLFIENKFTCQAKMHKTLQQFFSCIWIGIDITAPRASSWSKKALAIIHASGQTIPIILSIII